MATRNWQQERRSRPREALPRFRWHGRGGQGAVTAAKMVAELALGQGKYFQAFPEYGPERFRGADRRLHARQRRAHPDLRRGRASADRRRPRPVPARIIDVTKGAPADAVVLVNSEMSPPSCASTTGSRGAASSPSPPPASPPRRSAVRSPTRRW